MQFSGITNHTKACSATRGILHCYKTRLTYKNGEDDVKVDKTQIKSVEWYCVGRKIYQVAVFHINKTPPLKFQGFQQNHKDQWEQYVKEHLKIEFNAREVTLSGVNFGKFKIKSTELQFRSEEDEIISSMSYNRFSDVVKQGKREVGVLFKYNPQSREDEVMTEMRVVIPDNEEDAVNEDIGEAAQQFMKILRHKARLTVDESTVIAEFSQIQFRTPRGKARVRFFKDHVNIFAKTSSNLKYEQIVKLFLFQQPNLNHALVVVLDQPLRQGVTEYRYLVMEFQHESQCEVELNIDNKEIQQYALKGKQLIQKSMTGTTHNVVSKILLALAKVKIYTSRNFTSHEGTSCVTCSLKGNEGMLFPLERSFFFIHKPTAYIKHNEVGNVVFKYDEKTTNLRTFELVVTLRSPMGLSTIGGVHSVVVFKNIKKNELGPLVTFLKQKNLVIPNLRNVEQLWESMQTTTGRRRRTAYVPGSMTGLDTGGDDDDEEESPDDDYDMDTDMNMLQEDQRDDDEYHSDHEEDESEEKGEVTSGGNTPMNED